MSSRTQDSRPWTLDLKIHLVGILLFLFIPLVLFLFLRFPFGVIPSFVIAIVIMFGHRLLAIPFMNHYSHQRCFWCGRTARTRNTIGISARQIQKIELCREECTGNALRFFDFCSARKILIRIGIFIPLIWYVITTPLIQLQILQGSIPWNRFAFQFFIAITVVSLSFLYRSGREVKSPAFAFPIHNLFLLGARNTLQVFRYVGLWWIAISLLFVLRNFRLISF